MVGLHTNAHWHQESTQKPGKAKKSSAKISFFFNVEKPEITEDDNAFTFKLAAKQKQRRSYE